MSTGQTDIEEGYTAKLNALRVAVNHLGAEDYMDILDTVAQEIDEYGHLEEETQEDFKNLLLQLYDESRKGQERFAKDMDTYSDKQDKEAKLRKHEEDQQKDSEYLVKKGEQLEPTEYTTLEVEKKNAETEKSAFKKDIDSILGAFQLISENSDTTYERLQNEAREYHQNHQD